jgi:hypothetical protein
MVRVTESKVLRYGSKVVIHVPMKMARDSAFPFFQEEGCTSEDCDIEIKGKSLLIKKKKEV